MKKAKHYYNWGDEPVGYVSTGYYDKSDIWRSTGLCTKEKAIQLKLTYNCPYS